MPPKKSMKKRNSRKKKLVIRKPSASLNIQRQIYHFRRFAFGPTITGNAIHLPYLNGISFRIDQVINPNEFANLFDNYRINAVSVRFFLRIDPGAQTAATANYPRLYYVRDYDDSVIPSTLNEIREHGMSRVKVLRPDRPVSIYLKPAIADTIFRTGALTSTVPKWKQWVDMAHQNVEHYGLKYGIDDLTNTNYRVDLEVVYYFSCKGLR